MQYRRRKAAALVVLAAVLVTPLLSHGQFGGVVYDPTNYANALLRYGQLQRHLLELQTTVAKVSAHLNLAMQMAEHLRNMPARYKAPFSAWRSFTASDVYGNTGRWVGAVNGGAAQTIRPAYEAATVPLSARSLADLDAMNPADAATLKSAYASLELADGANVAALATVGNIRANAALTQEQIANLENDSFSDEASLNSEVGVLNKINAGSVLVLRTLQDANSLRLVALEQQVIEAKRRRDAEAANLDFAIQIHTQATHNLTTFNSNLTESLRSFRLP